MNPVCNQCFAGTFGVLLLTSRGAARVRFAVMVSKHNFKNFVLVQLGFRLQFRMMGAVLSSDNIAS